MTAEQMRKRADAIRSDDLVYELRTSLITGCGIRKKFKMALWEIVTGERWVDARQSRRLAARCIRCGHYTTAAFGAWCDKSLDPNTCNEWKPIGGDMPSQTTKGNNSNG